MTGQAGSVSHGKQPAEPAASALRVLSWNIFHGRNQPLDPSDRTLCARLRRRRPLFDEFAGWIAGGGWDVALLQEAPPRWFPALAQRSRAHGTIVLTSRNLGAPLRRAIADVAPDLIASNEGGSNQLLVRPPIRIAGVRRVTLALEPERRRMQFVRLELPGGRQLCVANMHATASRGDRAAAPEVERAAEVAVDWARHVPLIFGGDLNLQPRTVPATFEALRERHGLGPPTGPKAIDHLLVRGLDVLDAPTQLAPEERELELPGEGRVRLSDHAPVLASFRM